MKEEKLKRDKYEKREIHTTKKRKDETFKKVKSYILNIFSAAYQARIENKQEKYI